MAAGTALDVDFLMQGAEDVTGTQHVMRLMREESQVMQARPGAACEGHVVHGLLPVHPGGVEGLGILDGFRQPETQRPVVLVGGPHVGNHDVEMINPRHLGAAAQVVTLLEPVGVRRVMEELDGEAQRVLGPDGRADPGRLPGGQARRPAAEAVI